VKFAHFQQRDDHWAVIDLFGKGDHVRTGGRSGDRINIPKTRFTR
jgi:hypothetical protein